MTDPQPVPQPQLDKIPLKSVGTKSTYPVQVVRMTLDSFYTQVLRDNDGLVVADQHNESDFVALGQSFGIFKKAGVSAVFVEQPKGSQGRMDELVRNAKARGRNDDDADVKYGSVVDELAYPSRQTGIRLVCIDTDSKWDTKGVGKGNAAQQKAAADAYPTVLGLDIASFVYDRHFAKRMSDNDIWVQNVTEYVRDHNTDKFVLIGGTGHISQQDDIDERLARDLKKKVVTVHIHTQGVRAISPIITKGTDRMSGIEHAKGPVSPHYHVYIPQDIGLTPEESNRIHDQYVPLDASALRLHEIEFYKWKHGHAVVGANASIRRIDDMLAGKSEALNEFIKAGGQVTAKDIKVLKDAKEELNLAKAALNEKPPQFKDAELHFKNAKAKVHEEFMGGETRLREVCKAMKPDSQFWMCPSNIVGDIASGSNAVAVLHAELNGDLAPLVAPTQPGPHQQSTQDVRSVLSAAPSAFTAEQMREIVAGGRELRNGLTTDSSSAGKPPEIVSKESGRSLS